MNIKPTKFAQTLSPWKQFAKVVSEADELDAEMHEAPIDPRKAADEAIDLARAAVTLACSICHNYGLDAAQVVAENEAKCERKGYFEE